MCANRKEWTDILENIRHAVKTCFHIRVTPHIDSVGFDCSWRNDVVTRLIVDSDLDAVKRSQAVCASSITTSVPARPSREPARTRCQWNAPSGRKPPDRVSGCQFSQTPSASTAQRVSFADGNAQDEYHQNIQIAELNALNAALAVIRWKKHCGFYHDLEHEHDTTYAIDGNQLVNEDLT